MTCDWVPDSSSLQSQEIAIVSDEIRGSYRDLIYIVAYQQEGGNVSWSASLEDDEGSVTFITSHFICSLGKVHCEKLIRQRVFASIDEYHRRHETPTLH